MSIHSTVIDGANFCRDLLKQYVHEEMKTLKMSGVVEVDESLSRRDKQSTYSSWAHRSDSVRSTVSDMSSIHSIPADKLAHRLKSIREEGAPKSNTGPPLSSELAPIIDVLLSKPDFQKTMKIYDSLPRSENFRS